MTTVFVSTAEGRRRLLDELDQARIDESRARMERSQRAADHRIDTIRSKHDLSALAGVDERLAESIRRRNQLEEAIALCGSTTAPAPSGTDMVEIGHDVTFRYLDTGVEKMIHIGGYGETMLEAEPPIHSYACPLCSAMIGKEVGDIFILARDRKFEIIHIQLPTPSEQLVLSGIAA